MSFAGAAVLLDPLGLAVEAKADVRRDQPQRPSLALARSPPLLDADGRERALQLGDAREDAVGAALPALGHRQRTRMFSRWNARRASQNTARSSAMRTALNWRKASLLITTRPVTCAMPMPTTGTTTRPPICCATRTSLTRVEMRMPRLTESRVRSGTSTMIARIHRGAVTAFTAACEPSEITVAR